MDNRWKLIYEYVFFRTPKKLRRTSAQISRIRSEAKIYVILYM